MDKRELPTNPYGVVAIVAGLLPKETPSAIALLRRPYTEIPPDFYAYLQRELQKGVADGHPADLLLLSSGVIATIGTTFSGHALMPLKPEAAFEILRGKEYAEAFKAALEDLRQQLLQERERRKQLVEFFLEAFSKTLREETAAEAFGIYYNDIYEADERLHFLSSAVEEFAAFGTLHRSVKNYFQRVQNFVYAQKPLEAASAFMVYSDAVELVRRIKASLDSISS